MPTILCTKSIDVSFQKDCMQANISLLIQPMIQITTIEDSEVIEQIKHLHTQKITTLFTSVNSVKAVAKWVDRDISWDIFCISGATLESIKFYFPNCKIKASAISATWLLNAIEHLQFAPQTIHFFKGSKSLPTIPKGLQELGWAVKEYEVYKNEFISQPIQDALDGIMFYSPSGIHSFAKSNQINKALPIFAIGKTTAEAAQLMGFKQIKIAPIPNDETMINMVKSYFKN